MGSPCAVSLLVLCVHVGGPHTTCPDIQSNTTPCLFVRVISDEINIQISRQSKADCPSQCGGSHRTSGRPEQNKSLTLAQERGGSSCLAVFQQGHHILPAFGLELDCQFFLGLEPVVLRLELSQQIFWFSGCLTWIGIHITGSPKFPVSGLQILGMVSLRNHKSQFLRVNICLSVCLSIHLSKI